MLRRLIPAIAAALAAAVAGNASASPRSTTNFCTASKSVVVQLVNTASALKSTATLAQREAELKTQFQTIKSAEPSLKRSVPRRLKPKLNSVLGLVDLVNTKMAALHWNLAALVQDQAAAASIEAAANRANAAIPALRTYYVKTCHYKV